MTEVITSLQNPRVKLAHTLQQKARARRAERKIVLEGTRLIDDATQQGFRPQFVLYDPNHVDYELIARLQEIESILLPASAEIMKHVSDTENPQGIAAVYGLPYPAMPQKANRILLLDAIREPGNMGTILRAAGAAGVEIVLLAPGCVDPYNPKVLRSGMGAHFRVPLVEANWHEIKAYCEHTSVYVAAGDGSRRYSDVDWNQPWTLLIGNEAHGAGTASSNLPQERISIPMEHATESINAAVATGVILFEAQRQRLQSS
jgi:TrmH family RNA methyltransferase